jgi:hypothetical protein
VDRLTINRWFAAHKVLFQDKQCKQRKDQISFKRRDLMSFKQLLCRQHKQTDYSKQLLDPHREQQREHKKEVFNVRAFLITESTVEVKRESMKCHSLRCCLIQKVIIE